MSYVDILEGSTLSPRAVLELGYWDSREATFSYVFRPPPGAQGATVAGLNLPDQPGSFNGSIVTCVGPRCPAVPAGLPYYVVYFALAHAKKLVVSDVEFRVWPASLDVELVPYDENNQVIANEEIPFEVVWKKPPDGLVADGGVLSQKTSAVNNQKQVALTQAKPVEVRFPKPYVFKQWDVGSATQGRVRRARIQTTFTAGFLGPLADAKVQQVINRASGAEGRDGKGRVITFLVGGKGDGAREAAAKIAIEGMDVFITCTFSRKSKRTDELPALKGVLDLVSTEGGKVQKGRVTIGANKQASFKVDLGIAGGETCKVEVGARKGTVTDTLTFETWREVEYELLQPVADGADRLTDFTILKSKTVLGLKDETLAATATCLDDVFIKLVKRREEFLRKTDLSDGGNANVVDGEFFKKTAGTKVFVLSLGQQTTLLDTLMQHRDGRTMSILLCDHLVMPKQWDQSFDQLQGPGAHDVRDELLVLEHTLDDSVGGVGAGVFCIQKLAWKAIKSRTPAPSEDDFPGYWEDITEAQDPGGVLRTGAEYTTEVAIRAHVELVDSRKLRFKAAVGAPSYLGVRLPVVDGTFTSGGREFQILLQLQGVGLQPVRGSARRGNTALSTVLGVTHPNALARALTHELGHNMGQAYGGKALDAVLGRPAAIPGLPFPAVVPEGDVYTGHSHQGLHCANGLTKKGEASYHNSQYPEVELEHTCVMFGEGDKTNAKVYTFCAGCKERILAEDLSDIRRDWRS